MGLISRLANSKTGRTLLALIGLALGGEGCVPNEATHRLIMDVGREAIYTGVSAAVDESVRTAIDNQSNNNSNQSPNYSAPQSPQIVYQTPTIPPRPLEWMQLVDHNGKTRMGFVNCQGLVLAPYKVNSTTNQTSYYVFDRNGKQFFDFPAEIRVRGDNPRDEFNYQIIFKE